MNTTHSPELIFENLSKFRRKSIELALELAKASGFCFTLGNDGSAIFNTFNLNAARPESNFSIDEISGVDPYGYPSYYKLVYPEDIPIATEMFNKVRSQDPGSRVVYEFRIVNRIGEMRWVKTMLTPAGELDGETYYVGALIDITKDKEREETQQLIETLAAILRDVSERMGALEKGEDLLHRILKQIKEILPQTSGTSIYFTDGKDLKLEADENFTDTETADSAEEILDLDKRGTIREIIRTQQPIVISDTNKDKRWLRTKGGRNIMSYIGIPLISNGKVIAILNINSHTTNGFREGDLRMVSSITGFMPIILERIPIGTNIEIGVETHRLKEMFPQLVTLNQSLKRELEVVNSEMSGVMELLGRVIHDLKTPLSTIIISAHILRSYSDRLTPDKKDEKLDVITQMARSLTDEIDEILRLANLKLSNSKLSLIETDMVKYINSIIDPFLNSREVNLELEPVVLEIDQKLMKSVIDNLILNAIKYSTEGSRINVKMNVDENSVLISVQDFGIGIPADFQSSIFSEFARADNTRGIKGTGLGLFYIKLAVEKHGGTIYFESQENVGTTFFVRLPLKSEREA